MVAHSLAHTHQVGACDRLADLPEVGNVGPHLALRLRANRKVRENADRS
jgi:hypothetical protein